MRKVRIFGAVLLFVIIIAVFLSGEMIYSRRFVSITPHLKQSTRDDGVLTAENYGQLKNQIVKLIESAQTEGNIRLYDYMTDVTEDLPKACHEVMTQEPLGAYAVDVMTIDHTKILSYYDVKVSISYSRPREQVLALKKIESTEDFQIMIRDALLGFNAQTSALINYYTIKLYDPEKTKAKLILDYPDTLYGLPEMNIQYFPESGLHKILLFNIKYSGSKETLTEKRAQANALITELTGKYKVKSERETLKNFVGEITKRAQYDAGAERGAGGSDLSTPYGVLLGKHGISIGFAAALKKLCDEAGLHCIIVKGTYNGVQHYWNMVFTDNKWYHIDTANESQNPGKYFMRTDAEMAGYSWDDLEFPIRLRVENR